MANIKVVTGLVRFSYVHVYEPTAMEEGQDKKYNVSILIPKTDKKTIKKFRDAEKEALAALKIANGGKLPKAGKLEILRDGDEEKEGDEAYEGMYFFGASSLKKPRIFDINLDEIMDPDEFYSGCWGRATVNVYEFLKGKKGITCGLQGLQKRKDGEPLGGGGASASDFDDDFEDDDMLD